MHLKKNLFELIKIKILNNQRLNTSLRIFFSIEVDETSSLFIYLFVCLFGFLYVCACVGFFYYDCIIITTKIKT